MNPMKIFRSVKNLQLILSDRETEHYIIQEISLPRVVFNPNFIPSARHSRDSAYMWAVPDCHQSPVAAMHGSVNGYRDSIPVENSPKAYSLKSFLPFRVA